MAEHPILFNGDMVRATLDGRKTMTRRVIKPQPGDDLMLPSYVPYGEVGDRLWVRETWGDRIETGKMDSCTLQIETTAYGEYSHWVEYAADCDLSLQRNKGCWKPSIFMPRWASRITAEITSLGAERVQEISEDDAVAEGISRPKPETWWQGYTDFHGDLLHQESVGPQAPDWMIEPHKMTYTGLPFAQPLSVFRDLWDSINAKPKPVKTKGKITSYISYPWEDIQETREHRGLPWRVMGNPMLWVIGFKVLEGKDAYDDNTN